MYWNAGVRECRAKCPLGRYAVPSNLSCIPHEHCTGRVYQKKFCYAKKCPENTVEYLNKTEQLNCLDECPDGWYKMPNGTCIEEKCPDEWP
jgi:hypothetical protein